MALVCAFVTASDVRAQWPRRCIYSAFRRVTEDSNPRDGLFEAATPALQGVQRLSPNDSRNGSNIRALTALLESWVNDSRDGVLPGERSIATPTKRVRRRRAANQPHKTGGCLPLLASTTGVATALPGEQ